MAKRTFNDETPLSHNKAKLHHQLNPDEQVSDTCTPDSLFSSLASPERRENRKRTIDSESTDLKSGTLEAVEIKRARKDSREPLDPDPELWPSIRYDPSAEKPKWFDERSLLSYRNYLLSEKAYNESYNEDDMPAEEPNPLTSPESSDRDAAETVNPDYARHPTTNPYRVLFPQSLRKCDTILSQRKRREPLEESGAAA